MLLKAFDVCVQYFMEMDLWKIALYIACIIFLIVIYFAVNVWTVHLHVFSEVNNKLNYIVRMAYCECVIWYKIWHQRLDCGAVRAQYHIAHYAVSQLFRKCKSFTTNYFLLVTWQICCSTATLVSNPHS